MMRRQHLSSALLLAAVAGTATAQSPPPVVTTARVDTNTSWHKSEMALGVSPTTLDVMAAWHEHPDTEHSHVYYTLSTDGYDFGVLPDGVTEVTSAPVPLPSTWTEAQGADPMVAFAQDGRGWVGYCGRNPDLFHETCPTCLFYDRFWVAEKDPGYSAAGTAVAYVPGFRADKGWLTAGPSYGHSSDPDISGLLYSWRDGFGDYSLYAQISPPTGTTINQVHDSSGNPGTDGAVILRGGTYDGWWVAGFHVSGTNASNLGVRRSEDGGVTWSSGTGPSHTRNPVTHSAEVITQGYNPPVTGTDAQPGAVLNQYFQALAADPSPGHEGYVYMAFIGNPPTSDTENIEDIYIARSTDGGINFDHAGSETSGERVLRLRGYEDLGDEPNSIHALPSISVDDWGGVHVLYYVGHWVLPPDREPPYWAYKVRLVNIPAFSTLNPTGISVYDITSYEFRLDDSSVWDHSTRPVIGDYMNTCAVRGCQVWMGYIAPPEEGGPVGVFIANALIPNSACAADSGCYANCDGSTTLPVLNIDDFICFQEQYAAGSTYANCDHSTSTPVLNINDYICFMQKYSAGCT